MHRVSICLVAISCFLFPGVCHGEGMFSQVSVGGYFENNNLLFTGVGQLQVSTGANLNFANGNMMQAVQFAVGNVSTDYQNFDQNLTDKVTVTETNVPGAPINFTGNPAYLSFSGMTYSSGQNMTITGATGAPWQLRAGGIGSTLVNFQTKSEPTTTAFTLSFTYAAAAPTSSTNSVDFGSYAQNSGTQSMGFSITNMENAAGDVQAGLDLTSITSKSPFMIPGDCHPAVARG
jgi:hypothetical protein